MELLITTRNRGESAEISEALFPLRLKLRRVFESPEVPAPLQITFAQMLPAVKRPVSHRGRALALEMAALRRDPDLLR